MRVFLFLLMFVVLSAYAVSGLTIPPHSNFSASITGDYDFAISSDAPIVVSVGDGVYRDITLLKSWSVNGKITVSNEGYSTATVHLDISPRNKDELTLVILGTTVGIGLYIEIGVAVLCTVFLALVFFAAIYTGLKVKKRRRTSHRDIEMQQYVPDRDHF